VKGATAGLFAALTLFVGRSAMAGDCLSRPERFQLNSDTVYWSFSLMPGGECLQGLRGKTQLLNSVSLIEPPQSGHVVISGPSFRYQASSFPANDKFTIAVEGENRRQRGASLIVLDVTVK
jgi:hypothetical protein